MNSLIHIGHVVLLFRFEQASFGVSTHDQVLASWKKSSTVPLARTNTYVRGLDVINFIFFQGFLLYIHYMRENVRFLSLSRPKTPWYGLQSVVLTHTDPGSRLSASSSPFANNSRFSTVRLREHRSMSVRLRTPKDGSLRTSGLSPSLINVNGTFILTLVCSYVFHDEYSIVTTR